MKKPSLWAGIIGGLISIGNLFSVATFISTPTEATQINAANILSSIAWVAFGAFLLVLYFQSRQTTGQEVVPDHDTPADKAILARRQHWIIACVITLLILGSIQTWVLNDYFAGFTPTNVQLVSDILFNIFFFIVAIDLFRSRATRMSLFYYAILAYTVVQAACALWAGRWSGAFAVVAFAVFFVFAIKAVTNRKNFRIANLIILPAALVLTIASGTVYATTFNKLAKDEAKQEQLYIVDNSSLAAAYGLYLQKEIPTATDIRSVRDEIKKRDARIQQVSDAIDALGTQAKKDLPDVPTTKLLKRLDITRTLLELNRKQAAKIEELLAFTEKAGPRLTEKQRDQILTLKQAIVAVQTELTDEAVKLEDYK